MLTVPLAVTSDPALLGEIERVAAAAGVRLEHADAIGSAGTWRDPPVLVLDAAQVGAAVAARLPRRDGVIVVTDQELDAEQWASCVALGVDRVIDLGGSEGDLVRLLAETAETGGAGDGNVIAVIGACGGAGASVFAAAMALAARRSGRPVVLADTDPWGAGIDVTMGSEATDGARWGDIAAPSGRLPADALHRALPAVHLRHGSISVLSHSRCGACDVDPGLVDTVLDAARRAGDICVVNLPRAPLPAADRAAARADLTVLVVPADVRGCYGAAKVARRLADLGARVGLVVRGPSPGGLGGGDIARTLQLPLLAGMRAEPRLERRLDAGQPPGGDCKGPLGRAAAAVLAELSRHR